MRVEKEITGVFPIPNDPDEGEVVIRYLPPGELADINYENRLLDMRVREAEGGKMVREGVFKSAPPEKRYAIVVACVKDWLNFFGEDDAPLPCTPEAVVEVCRKNHVLVQDEGESEPKLIEFSDFVGRCREKLDRQVVEKKKALAKN